MLLESKNAWRGRIYGVAFWDLNWPGFGSMDCGCWVRWRLTTKHRWLGRQLREVGFIGFCPTACFVYTDGQRYRILSVALAIDGMELLRAYYCYFYRLWSFRVLYAPWWYWSLKIIMPWGRMTANVQSLLALHISHSACHILRQRRHMNIFQFPQKRAHDRGSSVGWQSGKGGGGVRK